MNKILSGILIFCLFSGLPAYAKQKQETEKPLLTVDAIVSKMKFQLGLSDEQIQEVKPIVQNYLDQEKALKLQEAKQLSKVLTGSQMFTWNFLQTEPSKKKGRALF